MVIVVLDVAAVATAAGQSRSTTALVVGCAGGRLAVTWACRREAPASDIGLGAWVARSVSTRAAVAATVVTAAICGVVAAAGHRHHVAALGTGLGALAAAVVAGAVVRRVGCRAFGGLTGDVLGAVISCGATAAYLVVALTGSLVQ